MINKSRDDVAFTLIDLENEIPNSVIENINRIDGVLTVRVL